MPVDGVLLGGPVDHARRESAVRAAVIEMLSLIDIGSIRPSVFRSSGISAMRSAALRGGARARRHAVAAVECGRCRSTPAQHAEQREQESRCWPWPSRPPRPTISPLPSVKRDVGEAVGPAQVRDLELGRRRLGPHRLRRVDARRRRGRSSSGRSRRPSASPCAKVADVAAVAEHRDGVGQLLDLVHAVRDVEERRARPRAAGAACL